MRWAMGMGIVLLLGCSTPAPERTRGDAADAAGVAVQRGQGEASAPPAGRSSSSERTGAEAAVIRAASTTPDPEPAREEKSRARRFADLILGW